MVFLFPVPCSIFLLFYGILYMKRKESLLRKEAYIVLEYLRNILQRDILVLFIMHLTHWLPFQ